MVDFGIFSYFICLLSFTSLFLFILEHLQIYKIVVEIQNNPHLPGPLGLGTVVILLWQSLVEGHSLHYRLFRNALASIHSHHWYPHTTPIVTSKNVYRHYPVSLVVKSTPTDK